jgi:hypothetical protein
MPSPSHAERCEGRPGKGFGFLFGHAHLDLIGDLMNGTPGSGSDLQQLVHGELLTCGFQIVEGVGHLLSSNVLCLTDFAMVELIDS